MGTRSCPHIYNNSNVIELNVYDINSVKTLKLNKASKNNQCYGLQIYIKQPLALLNN